MWVVVAAVVLPLLLHLQLPRWTETPLPHTFQQHALVMTSTRVPTQAACFQACSAAPHPSIPRLACTSSSASSSLSCLEALWDDDDTRRNRWMLSFWHDTQSENPSELIQVSLLHSGTVRPLTSAKAFRGRIGEVSEVGPWLTALLRKQNLLLRYLISAQQRCTFALLTWFFFLTGLCLCNFASQADWADEGRVASMDSST